MSLVQRLLSWFRPAPSPVEASAPKPTLTIRWAGLSDAQSLARLEETAGGIDRFDLEVFVDALTSSRVRILGCFEEEQARGYLAFERKKQAHIVLNLLVDPDWRRLGIGSLLVECVQGLQEEGWRKDQLLVLVREGNLPGQLFFKSLGFLCTAYEDDGFLNPEEPALVFRWIRGHGE